MKKNLNQRITLIFLVGGFRLLPYLAAGKMAALSAAEGKVDTAKIEQLTGVKGELNEKEGVFKVSVPRTDLQVTTAGVKDESSYGVDLICSLYESRCQDNGYGGHYTARRPGQSCNERRAGRRAGSYSPS